MGLKIEQFGLCGAGKTTFLKSFAPMLESYSHLNISKPIIPSQKKLFICFIKILLTGFLIRPMIFTRFLLKNESWWLVKKLAYRYASSTDQINGNLLLEDGGILQPFLSFEIEKNLSNILVPFDCLLKCCQLPDIVLNFNVSPSIAMTRYETRGLKGEGQTIRENSKIYFHRASELQKKLITYCQKKKVYIIDIDSQHEFTNKYIKAKFNEINTLLTEEKK